MLSTKIMPASLRPLCCLIWRFWCWIINTTLVFWGWRAPSKPSTLFLLSYNKLGIRLSFKNLFLILQSMSQKLISCLIKKMITTSIKLTLLTAFLQTFGKYSTMRKRTSQHNLRILNSTSQSLCQASKLWPYQHKLTSVSIS